MTSRGQFNFAGKEIIANYREDTNDWNTLFSCLNEDEYGIAKLPEIKDGLAIDLGAHIGGVTLALATKGLKVYSVEMLPENMQLLRENLLLNNYAQGEVLTFQNAIVGKTVTKGEVDAYYADGSSESGKAHEFIGTTMPDKFIADTKKHGRSIKVQTLSLKSMLMSVGVCDFLKIDIEGAEWEIIKNTPQEFLNKVKRIIVEIEGIDKEVSTADFLKFLPKGFKDVSKEYFPKWCEPSTIIHGYYINEEL